MAGSANSFIFMNHCVESSGSSTVLQRWQVPDAQGIILDLLEQALLAQILHHLLPRLRSGPSPGRGRLLPS